MTTILVVEDNDDSAFMLKGRLKRKGFDVSIAVNGREGVDMTQQQQPDLVLMDIDLPIIDGLEATRRLKGAADTSAIPIIALTAHAMVGDREKAMQAGCDDFDTKPVDMTRLLEKIKALLPAGPE